jgi:hypothetical protein
MSSGRRAVGYRAVPFRPCYSRVDLPPSPELCWPQRCWPATTMPLHKPGSRISRLRERWHSSAYHGAVRGQAARVPVERRAGAGLLQVFRRAGRVPQGRPASASGAVTAAALVANPPRRTRRGRQVGAEVPRPVTADMSAMVAPQLMSQVSDAQAPR